LAKAAGLFFSFVNLETYSTFNEKTFVEALTDWGFFGDPSKRPTWLGSDPKRQ